MTPTLYLDFFQISELQLLSQPLYRQDSIHRRCRNFSVCEIISYTFYFLERLNISRDQITPYTTCALFKSISKVIRKSVWVGGQVLEGEMSLTFNSKKKIEKAL